METREGAARVKKLGRMRTFSLLVVLSLVLTAGLAQADPGTVIFGASAKGSDTVFVAAARNGDQWLAQRDMGQLAGPQQYGHAWQLFGLTSTVDNVPGKGIKMTSSAAMVAKLSDRASISALAVSGGSARQPRTATLVKDAAVVDALTAWLRDKGVRLSKARVTQSARVDLLGDGHPEWLVCGSSRDDIVNGNAKANPSDYSFAVMVWNDPKTSSLHIEPLHSETVGDRFVPSNLYEFVGVADLDRSGHMSVALRARYFQGGRLDIWSYDGQRVSRGITNGWQL